MATRARHGSYIFQRSNSRNWWVLLRSPGEKRFERSLGTADKLVAEAKAAELIAAHKRRLFEARPRFETAWTVKFEPGRLHFTAEGEKMFATDRELHYLDDAGKTIVRTEPNGEYMQLLLEADGPYTPEQRYFRWRRAMQDAHRAPLVTKNGDDALFQTYLDHGGKKRTGVHGHYRQEAEAVWSLFRQLTGNKALKDCDRNDGRKLVTHFQAEGLKSATIQKKIMWVNAACNLAIAEGKLRFNPFSAIAPDGGDEAERLPLSDADMKLCKRNLAALGKADQLLFRVLASTGCRLSEAFEIGKAVEWEEERVVGERTEMGIRYCIIGHKSEASKRRMPFPADLLPHLPRKITGKLFVGTEAAASKRLNRFLRRIGIADPRKVVHSARHRAKDTLRAVECPRDIQLALLGHDEKTVADDYGRGYPVRVLRKWIDRIGF